MPTYETIDVSSWPVASEEPLGSKEKDWLRRPVRAGGPDELWLWKAARERTGDDWAEWASGGLAALLGLPHAAVELASRGGRRGTISRDFRHRRGAFVPGNELLWLADPSYPRGRKRKVAQHTVERVLARLGQPEVLVPPGLAPEFRTADEVFVGYLMFDAWIGNQDRHHENWGVVVWDERQDAKSGADPVGGSMQVRTAPMLAPSFDHAASLGQSQNDSQRELRLNTRDRPAHIESWARTARSPFYGESVAQDRPLTTFEAFDLAAARLPDAAAAWLRRLQTVEWADVASTIAAVPDSLITPTARTFALRLLEIDRTRLLSPRQP